VRQACLIAMLLVAMLVPASAAVAGGLVAFRTPSGNIGCVYAAAAGGQPTSLRCDIRSRLRPRPPRPANCDLDWGDSYSMNRIGRVVLTCHGDTAILPDARVLRYGTTWRRAGFTCSSSRAGLRCVNASKHGFFLSRARSYRF
jgi:hypothetical protein